ncbi:MAG: hypothetical protein CBC34_022145 [Hyphomicrobiaceae bacterium TMED74]|jgi:hypothetical protein|nr:hypothetical protein [Filomicrobium sp.]RPG35383.1 MAG: hypothetical protein CBC34_022145 [Hyphomicrobiaceae bacterium TMED74]
MSIRAIPLLIFVFLSYNAIVLAGGSNPDEVLRQVVLPIPMLNGHVWTFSWGDLVILLLLIMLFVELLKATYTSSASLLDHGLSMLVFVVCLIEFLMVRQAQTSVFFFIVVATLIDVIAGYTIGIRVARRDLSIGG